MNISQQLQDIKNQVSEMSYKTEEEHKLGDVLVELISLLQDYTDQELDFDSE